MAISRTKVRLGSLEDQISLINAIKAKPFDQNSYNIVKATIDKGMSLDFTWQGKTPFVYAVEARNLRAFCKLVKAGADIDFFVEGNFFIKFIAAEAKKIDREESKKAEFYTLLAMARIIAHREQSKRYLIVSDFVDQVGTIVTPSSEEVEDRIRWNLSTHDYYLYCKYSHRDFPLLLSRDLSRARTTIQLFKEHVTTYDVHSIIKIDAAVQRLANSNFYTSLLLNIAAIILKERNARLLIYREGDVIDKTGKRVTGLYNLCRTAIVAHTESLVLQRTIAHESEHLVLDHIFRNRCIPCAPDSIRRIHLGLSIKQTIRNFLFFFDSIFESEHSISHIKYLETIQELGQILIQRILHIRTLELPLRTLDFEAALTAAEIFASTFNKEMYGGKTFGDTLEIPYDSIRCEFIVRLNEVYIALRASEIAAISHIIKPIVSFYNEQIVNTYIAIISVSKDLGSYELDFSPNSFSEACKLSNENAVKLVLDSRILVRKEEVCRIYIDRNTSESIKELLRMHSKTKTIVAELEKDTVELALSEDARRMSIRAVGFRDIVGENKDTKEKASDDKSSSWTQFAKRDDLGRPITYL